MILNHFLPRPPAFLTLSPKPLTFDEVADFEALFVALNALAPGQLFKKTGLPDKAPGYYMYVTEMGSRIFLKVVPRVHASRLLESDNYARWTFNDGVDTCTLLPGFPINFGVDLTAFGYRHFEYRFANSNIADISTLGQNIAKLHISLGRYPTIQSIQRSTAFRMKSLLHRITLCAESTLSKAPNDALLREIYKKEVCLFRKISNSDRAQATHGDLVVGNVLFPLHDTTAPVFLDFEDTPISWAPIELDLALALERFVLLPLTKDEPAAIELGRMFFKAYSDAIGRESFLFITLEDCLKFLAVRALATLSELTATGQNVQISEWEKFFFLYQRAANQSVVLKQIESGFLLQ